MATSPALVSTKLVHLLLEHNAWATRVLLDRCRDLTPGQFAQTFEIGPGSLHDTLLHVVSSMGRWADRIGGRQLRDSLEPASRTWTPDELIPKLDEAAGDLVDVVAKVLEEDRLEEKMEFRVPGRPEPFIFTRGTAIVHVVTHGVHHRAQILNMLRRLGVEDLPDLDAVESELVAAGLPAR